MGISLRNSEENNKGGRRGKPGKRVKAHQKPVKLGMSPEDVKYAGLSLKAVVRTAQMGRKSLSAGGRAGTHEKE